MTGVYFLFLELLKNVTFSISNKDTLARSLAEQIKGNKNENKCDIKIHSALKCEKCKITFDNKFDWNEHIMKHTQEKMLDEVAQNSTNSLYCKLCKISFASKATWTEHILSHAKQKVMKHFMEIEKSMPQKPPFNCSKVVY